MARTWLAIRVELVGGRGEQLWPPPGRLLAVGPRHTFAHLAAAIDTAFARWDRAHLCTFELDDGTVVTDPETGEELGGSSFGPIARTLELGELVSRRVSPGSELKYVFDLGDDWVHCLTVEPEKIDPVEVVGTTPREPTAFWGWGAIPDQYGRRWDGDDGEGTPPGRPGRPHPMVSGHWPETAPDPVDAAALRGATARRDTSAILAALQGKDVDDALQAAGDSLMIALKQDRAAAELLAVSVANRLDLRGAEGDDVLREDLIAQLRGVPIAARHLPVDLAELHGALEGDPSQPGSYLDLHTGEVVPQFLTDPGEVGEDEAIDVDQDPERWMVVERVGSRAGWHDMAAFTARLPSGAVRERLESAIEGRGAFRRFRDVLGDVGLLDDWFRYADDREAGRARAYLAEHGIRVRPEL